MSFPFNTPLSDEQVLLYELSTGREDAFDKMYDHYVHSTYSFVIKFVKSPELAEDLTQEIFIKIWENRSQLSKVKSFRAYLFVTARNHVLNFLRKASNSNVVLTEIITSYASPQGANEMISREYEQWLHNVLESMSPQMRAVFKLCREQNKSYGEVADLLQISKNTVKKHMVRSMHAIKDRLDLDLGISICLFLFITLHSYHQG
jgi:RNA polymerase sigma-70 factor (ECF subfamily)